jgi:hypothetical protein
MTSKAASYNRTGIFITSSGNTSPIEISGCDLSALSSDCELLGGGAQYWRAVFSHCKMPSTYALQASAPTYLYATANLVNCANADAPAELRTSDSRGELNASHADEGAGYVYRSSGGSVETIAGAWLVTTTSYAREGAPFYTPWMYGTLSTTGSKTFTICVVSNSGGGGTSNKFTDAELWMELEYLGTSNGGKWAYANDRRTINATAADQASDSSTWNGTGPSFTNKQKLDCTVTVNEEGLYRARVCIAKASVTSSNYLYIDPKVTVT